METPIVGQDWVGCFYILSMGNFSEINGFDFYNREDKNISVLQKLKLTFLLFVCVVWQPRISPQ